ncbi:MAG: ORF6N domain-containing protein [Firmicutes bacterium]|nr:ORF6N domain-containing protein [Bacillota bacterium]
MKQVEKIAQQLPEIKIWNNQRVVTFKDIDEVHERPKGTASRNFKSNKKHFIKDVDYYLVIHEDFNGRNSSNGEKAAFGVIPPKGLTLLTESGYLMVVKSFTDDLSWEVQRRLVNNYFLRDEQSEETELPQKEKVLLKNSRTWFQQNNWKMKLICDYFDWERKYLYHKILREVSDIYDLDGLEVTYIGEYGHEPRYKMELLEFYPPAQETASRYIDFLLAEVEE